jgi:hypothetical protein
LLGAWSLLFVVCLFVCLVSAGAKSDSNYYWTRRNSSTAAVTIAE